MSSQYTPKPRRRNPHIDERTTPCQFCAYPITQRHHVFGFGDGMGFEGAGETKRGEKEFVLHLCANCHELYHIVWDASILRRKRAIRLLHTFIDTFGEGDDRLRRVHAYTDTIRDAIKEANGHLYNNEWKGTERW